MDTTEAAAPDYTVLVGCSNCQACQEVVTVPFGKPVDEHIRERVCPHCGCRAFSMR